MGRKRAVKFKRGYLASPYFSFERPSKPKLLWEFHCLSSLWKKGFVPRDLRRHYFLTWFAYTNGVLHKQARLLGMHRNAIIAIFGRMGLGTRTYKFRRLWLRLAKKRRDNSFHSAFFSFYRLVVKKQVFSPVENKALVQLWLSGFPLKVLSAHYVLWAFGKGISRREVARKLGITTRTLHRLVIYGSKRGSKAWTWLFSLNPQKEDWYPRWASHRE